GQATLRLGDARKLDVPSDSVHGIITSPPYAIALDYVARNEEQLAMMGYSLKETYERLIGLRGSLAKRIEYYYSDLERSIGEMHRVLKPGRSCVVVIGDTRFKTKTLPTIKKTIGFAENAGFKLV